MSTTRSIATTLTFCAIALTAQQARAGFTICNDLAESVWTAYSRIYRSRIVTYECSFSRVFDGYCDYSSYKTQGWWRIDPNQCRTVDSRELPPFADARSYVYLITESGDEMTDTSASFYVTNDRFTWDSDVRLFDLHPNECLIESGEYDNCTPSGYWADFREVRTSGFTNVTFRIQAGDIDRAGGHIGASSLPMSTPETEGEQQTPGALRSADAAAEQTARQAM